jgi:glycerol-3-phosphate dehydrogenase
MDTMKQPVVILGAGINGAALARELVLNRVPVVVVDTADVAYGTTAYSSRLIHGGLRYLEYGDVGLVRESLAERRRLLDLAPQFVQPLEIQVPVSQRGGGWSSAVTRFLGMRSDAAAQRGLWLIRSGLCMYDLLARDRQLPSHRVFPAGSPEAVPVDPERYHWLGSYWDAQMAYPERFVVALLEDARIVAQQEGIEFSLVTYHRAERNDTRLIIRPVDSGSETAESVRMIEPAAVVNATGAWVDHALRSLDVTVPRKIGGTKGTHFLTFDPALTTALGGRGLYAQARDGRPVFVLPLGAGVLVGTTDTAYDGDPGQAVATEAELDYLLELARRLLPQAPLTRNDIHLHYAGIRPLPYSGDKKPGAISRRHWLERHLGGSLPLYSIIGGKLTTCRSLAEDAARQVLKDLGRRPQTDSRDRVVPGGDNYPADRDALARQHQQLAARYALPTSSITAVWALLGSRTQHVLESSGASGDDLLPDTSLPRGVARWMISNEWASRLDDLVERRLMLLYEPRLSRACLVHLAELLVEAGKLPTSAVHDAVSNTTARLETHFGKHLLP